MPLHFDGDALRGSQRKPSLSPPGMLPLSNSLPKSKLVGSPINMLKSPNAAASPSPQRSGVGAVNANANALARKARPATALPLSSSVTLQSLLQSCGSTNEDDQASDTGQSVSNMDGTMMSEGGSAGRVRKHVTMAPIAPIKAFGPATGEGSPGAVGPGMHSFQQHVQRCAGCGSYAEVCMSCFSLFKKQDGAAYKKQIVRSVEVLFEKATTRAFTKMAQVIVQWIFGIWKREWQHNRHRRTVVLVIQRQRVVARSFRAWQEFLYKRRIVGAMLYAENQQQVTKTKTKEIASLHGDVFEVSAASNVRQRVAEDQMDVLRHQCAAHLSALQAKNAELVAMRKELYEARDRIATLEKQVIDPRDLERLKTEAADYKKITFQLVGSATQSLETQLDQLQSSEGRQNLLNMFSKDVLQYLDRPEYPGFYNPLMQGGSDNPELNLFSSYEAPVDRADRILMQWVNALLLKQPSDWVQAPRMVNFHSSLTDGKILIAITKVLHSAMCKYRPKRPPGLAPSKLEAASVLRENGEDLTEIAMERYLEHVKKEESPEKRLELMISTIGQALWLPVGMLSTKDVLAGDAEFNFASLCYLFVTFSPMVDEAFQAMCNDFKIQLSTIKTKWRELREGPTGANGTSVESSVAINMKIKLVLAQTMDLKRRMDQEEQKTREGHMLWFKSIRVVLRKCFVSFARLARGKAGVLTKLDPAGDENEAFAKIPKIRIQDLELPFEDFAWETKLLQSYLSTIYCDLARIYRGYATRNGVVNDYITVGDLVELLSECRVLDSVFTVQDVHNILKKIDAKLTSVSHHRALPPLEFLEALIRAARRKYSAENHRITISEAFCLFVDNFVLPFAFRADADMFRKQIEEPKIRRLFIRYAEEVREMYHRYALEDPKKRRKRPRMTAFTFSQCLLDYNIQDVSFNSEKVFALVQKVAQTAKKEMEASGLATITTASTVSDDDEITYEEFEEALVAIACYKFPDPYTSLESRVEKFFAFYLRDQMRQGTIGTGGAGPGGGGSGPAIGGHGPVGMGMGGLNGGIGIGNSGGGLQLK